jgi:hypothetical protein
MVPNPYFLIFFHPLRVHNQQMIKVTNINLNFHHLHVFILGEEDGKG